MGEVLPKKFIVITNNVGTSPYAFRDLRSDNRAIVINGFLRNIRNPLVKFIRKVHLSKKINIKIDLPFKRIWKCSLKDVDLDYNTEYYVILLGLALRKIDYSYLMKIQRIYSVKYILLMLDPWDGKNSIPARYFADKIKFDYIMSFDPDDVKKYNFIYINVPYSKIYDNLSYKIDADIYLAASVTSKGGVDFFHKVYEYSKLKGVNSYFRLVDVPYEDQVFRDEIIYNKPISYSEVVEGVLKGNCILEVLAKGQSGATLRYYEAVCYNKKLLTTNKNVVNLPFYNPDYIHVFEKPEDIDWEWVKERIPVDYHYDGRFSPTHLIDKIIELEEEREKKENGEKEDN